VLTWGNARRTDCVDQRMEGVTCAMKSQTVDQIMTARIVAVRMDDSVESVRDLFEQHRFHHSPVVESKS
jgi:predicted transcriptional regulator